MTWPLNIIDIYTRTTLSTQQHYITTACPNPSVYLTVFRSYTIQKFTLLTSDTSINWSVFYGTGVSGLNGTFCKCVRYIWIVNLKSKKYVRTDMEISIPTSDPIHTTMSSARIIMAQNARVCGTKVQDKARGQSIIQNIVQFRGAARCFNEWSWPSTLADLVYCPLFKMMDHENKWAVN